MKRKSKGISHLPADVTHQVVQAGKPKFAAENRAIKKIGVFDSGIGGKYIADKIIERLPFSTVVFRADSQYFPYGNKPASFILRRAISLTKELIAKKCQLIVIACNSATTSTIETLRKKFSPVEFVGIEPPVKPIVAMTRTGKVAVIGTAATIRSARFKELVKNYSAGVEVLGIVCLDLAEIIQKQAGEDEIESLLHKFLDRPVTRERIDVVGIACTHYSTISPLILRMYPQVAVYDPSDAVVNRVVALSTSRIRREVKE